MYSMVLMMAMTTSPDAAACHKTSCTGCTGVVVEAAGCTGCSGSRHGGGLFNKHGCSGGLFSGGLFKKHGCHGSSCMGSEVGCSGGGCIGAPVEVTPVTPVEEKKVMPKPKEEKTGGVTFAPVAPAFVTVNVPADAKVTIDGNATVSTSTVRIFSTPAMKSGTVHYYSFTAEVVRGGKVYSATEKVAVEAGARPVITLTPNVGQAFVSK